MWGKSPIKKTIVSPRNYGLRWFYVPITSAAGRIKLPPGRFNVHLPSNISRLKIFTFVLVKRIFYATLFLNISHPEMSPWMAYHSKVHPTTTGLYFTFMLPSRCQILYIFSGYPLQKVLFNKTLRAYDAWTFLHS
jgi:hypothetical protein